MSYDVAIVGAGPGGLHAAKWAAGKGLKVVLIEKRKDISKITRYCSEHIILDEDYNGDTIRVETGQKKKIVSTKNAWDIDYRGTLQPVTDKYYYSGNLKHNAHFTWPDKRPFAYKYDKGIMLKGLLDEVLKLGVEYMDSTTCWDIIDSEENVDIKCVSRGRKFRVKAKKLVAADGANAHIAQTLGMNNDRVYFGTALCLAVYMSNVREYNPSAWKAYWGNCYGSNLAPVMGTGPAGHYDDWADIIIVGSSRQTPYEVLEYFTMKSPVAWMFEKAKVEEKHCCSTKAYSPLKKPFQGNCLIIGDAAAFVETQAQGALNCGFWAADAVVKELEGKKGFAEYTDKWLKAFEFNDDGVLKSTTDCALIPYYNDNEIEYLFSLLDNVTLDGSWSQYNSPKIIWDAILKDSERIKREQPEIWEKISKQHSRFFQEGSDGQYPGKRRRTGKGSKSG